VIIILLAGEFFHQLKLLQILFVTFSAAWMLLLPAKEFELMDKSVEFLCGPLHT